MLELRAAGKGIQENHSALWLAVLDFMVMGLVSDLSLANHSGSESFLAHALFNHDGFHHKRFWEVGGHRDWHLLSAFELS